MDQARLFSEELLGDSHGSRITDCSLCSAMEYVREDNTANIIPPREPHVSSWLVSKGGLSNQLSRSFPISNRNHHISICTPLRKGKADRTLSKGASLSKTPVPCLQFRHGDVSHRYRRGVSLKLLSSATQKAIADWSAPQVRKARFVDSWGAGGEVACRCCFRCPLASVELCGEIEAQCSSTKL